MTSEMTATRSVIVLLPLSLFYSDASNESNKKQKGVGEENESKYIVRMYVYIYIYMVCMHSGGGRDDLLSGEETNIRFPRRGNERRAKMAA